MRALRQRAVRSDATRRGPITDAQIKALKPREQGYYEPTSIPGCRLYINRDGGKFWQVKHGRTMKGHMPWPKFKVGDIEAILKGVAEPSPSPPPAARSVREWLDEYVNDYDFTKLVSAKDRKRILNHFLQPIMHEDISALTRPWLLRRGDELIDQDQEGPGRLGRALRMQKGKLSRATVKYRRRLVRIFRNFVLGHDHKPLEMKPFTKNLPDIELDEDEALLLSRAEVSKLVLWCHECRRRHPQGRGQRRPVEESGEGPSYANYTLAAFIMVGLYGGLRPTEITTLQWKQVLFTDTDGIPKIVVLRRRSKNKKPGEVPINDELVRFLKERRDLGLLADESPFKYGSYGRWLREGVGPKVIGRPMCAKMFRHSYTTWIQSVGVGSLKDASKLARHRSTKPTEVYSHAPLEHLHEVVSRYQPTDRKVLALPLKVKLEVEQRRRERALDEGGK